MGGKHKDPLELAKLHPRSKIKAIAAKCYDCQGNGMDPGWRWLIGNCQITECPLWRHRPHQQNYNKKPPKSLPLAYVEEH